MTERLCYVLTAYDGSLDLEWVCCVFDTEAAAVAAHSAAKGRGITYEVSLVPFHSQTDTMPR